MEAKEINQLLFKACEQSITILSELHDLGYYPKDGLTESYQGETIRNLYDAVQKARENFPTLTKFKEYCKKLGLCCYQHQETEEGFYCTVGRKYFNDIIERNILDRFSQTTTYHNRIELRLAKVDVSNFDITYDFFKHN